MSRVQVSNSHKFLSNHIAGDFARLLYYLGPYDPWLVQGFSTPLNVADVADVADVAEEAEDDAEMKELRQPLKGAKGELF